MKKSCHPHASKDLKRWNREKNKHIEQIFPFKSLEIAGERFPGKMFGGDFIYSSDI
jgi:hypothetical protein